jgi:hypothetical protein
VISYLAIGTVEDGRECELGLALTTLGTIVIYGVKLIPRGRDSLGIMARRLADQGQHRS